MFRLHTAHTGALIVASALAACSMPPMSPSTSATTVNLGGTLSPAAEVPPTSSGGGGTVSATLDKQTKMLRYTVRYTGLTGPVTAAHFHGPAPAGQNAGVVLPFTGSLASPIEGSATLTDAQMNDLLAGRWYANLHTAANPGGEVRAQMMAR